MSESRYARIYLQPAFLICTGVLALAAVGMDRLHVQKAPFLLKKSLDMLDEQGLAPYTVVAKEKIENEEIIRELGTSDYIQWVLEDANAAADSAVRKCTLFVTYYELPDHVPHVPEECYMGTGHQVLASEGVTFEIGDVSHRPEVKTIEGKYVVFASTDSRNWWGDSKFAILYFFSVNGVYANSREDARWLLNKYIFSRYVYFSKVELKFFNTRFGQTIYPSKEEALRAGEKLLAVVLPVLEKEHWPDRPVVNESKK
ncbi:MAG TPA: hypothetical protein VMW16_07195 [Sedimentisphaerales bacterium]|nr:hypothetical protein [Sedimentisphaerales bacterium]